MLTYQLLKHWCEALAIALFNRLGGELNISVNFCADESEGTYALLEIEHRLLYCFAWKKKRFIKRLKSENGYFWYRIPDPRRRELLNSEENVALESGYKIFRAHAAEAHGQKNETT